MPDTTVAAIIVDENVRILLTQRKHPPFADMWCLPGGHIDRYEEALTAVIREVKEETGLEYTNIHFLGMSDEIYPELNIHNIVLVYTGMSKGTIVPQESEVTAFKWVYLNEVINTPLAFGQEKAIKKVLCQTQQ